MSRYIDADAIIEELLCTTPKLPYKSTTDLVRAQEIATFANKIDSAPSIDIVRCKECELFENGWCNRHDVRMNADDFCSYGCSDSEKPNNSKERSSE